MKRSPRHLASPDESEERRRKHEDFRHHAGAERTNPGLPHSPVPHPLRTKNHPHTQPEVYVLDADHGTHRDRPRPGKLGKKEQFRL